MESLAFWRRAEPDWVRPAPGPAGYRRDAEYAIGLALLGLVLTLTARAMGAEPYGHVADTWVQIVVVLAAALPLALRRRYPELIAVWEALALFFWQRLGLSEALSVNIYVFVALFTLGAWGRHRMRADVVRLLVFLAMFVWLATAFGFSFASDQPFPGSPPPSFLSPWIANATYTLIVNVVYFGAAWFFGNRAWTSALRDHDLAERTASLETERAANARAAVVGERVRIARELHDVIAHSVSLMGVQAAAARRTLERDPALASDFLAAVENTARNTVAELSGLLGVLRSDGPDGPDSDTALETAGGTVGIEQFDDLVGAARDAGLAAHRTVVGEPFELGQAVSVSLYRVAQEAVTNTIRHARASKVDLRLRYLRSDTGEPSSIELEVVDDGLPAVAATRGSGLGHVGMDERVTLHGGELVIGRRTTTRGYRVLARIPASTSVDRPCPTGSPEATQAEPAPSTANA
jgi:signal transduction histidine kinase